MRLFRRTNSSMLSDDSLPQARGGIKQTPLLKTTSYAAMPEVGRAQMTIFVARYLRLCYLQREIEEGLNVMEPSNSANSLLASGRGRRDRLEPARRAGDVHALHANPPVALIYVKTLMLQDILG
ncbi:Tn3 family transposase [Streptomyces sp. NPDC000405]|uniref:Tn3 family transposase n=1 Tax=Streptomyces sp. NPDC000405 TaxID=3161033 RepID=UPI00398CCC0B